MERNVAADVVQLMLEFGAKLDESVSDVMGVSNGDEYERYRSSVGKIMGLMLLDIMNPIFEEYPDLKPHQLL